jgi:hypothetical protein
MKKCLFLILTFFPLVVFSLELLPNNSYLRYKDNQPEVKILQEILNSDPDTIVAKSGPGSTGKENWFFGIQTEDALSRFQEKNGLSVTGKIDRATLKKLNEVASGNVNSIATNVSKKNSIVTLSESEKKVLKNELSQAIKKKNTEETKTSENPKTEESQTSILDSILNSYRSNSLSNLLNPTNTTQTNSQNQQSNPYLGNTSNPYLTSDNSQNFGNGGSFSSGNNSNSNPFNMPTFSGSTGGIFGGNQTNQIFGSNLDRLPTGPIGPGSINNVGEILGTLPQGSGSCGARNTIQFFIIQKQISLLLIFKKKKLTLRVNQEKLVLLITEVEWLSFLKMKMGSIIGLTLEMYGTFLILTLSQKKD